MTHPADTTGELFPWEEPDEKQGAAAMAPGPAQVEPQARADADAPTGGNGDDRAHDARDAIERGTATAQRDRPVAHREYYSISEVCDLVGLKPHVLRYWESQFQPLNPSKNRSGNRVYQRKEIQLIMLVKRLLYEDKYTIEGARARIEQMRRSGKVRDVAGHALQLETVRMLREELEQLRELLTPPT